MKQRSDTMNIILHRREIKRKKKINNIIIRSIGIILFVLSFVIIPLNEMDATPTIVMLPLSLLGIFKPNLFDFDIFGLIEEIKDDFKNHRIFR